MKQSLFALVFLFLPLSASLAKGVDSSHQVCKVDQDCQLVLLACACIHNHSCLGPDDKSNGIVDAVAKEFVRRYEHLSVCSRSETEQCAVAGACAQRGEWLPKCGQGKCALTFRPR